MPLPSFSPTRMLVLFLLIMAGSQAFLLFHFFKGPEVLSSKGEAWQSFAEDLNEIRSFLLLPTKNYGSGEVSAEEKALPAKDELRLALVEMLQSMQGLEEKEKARQESLGLMDSLQALNWEALELEVVRGEDVLELKDSRFLNATFLQWELSNTGRLTQSGLLNAFVPSLKQGQSAEAFWTEVQPLLAKELPVYRQALQLLAGTKASWEQELFPQENFQNLLKNNHLTLQGPLVEEGRVLYRLNHEEKGWMADFRLDLVEKNMQFFKNPALDEGNPVTLLAKAEEALPVFEAWLKEEDLRLTLERDLAEMEQEMQALMKDPAILKLLKVLGMRLVGPEKGEEFWVYKLEKEDGSAVKELKIRLEDAQIFVGDQLVSEHNQDLKNLLAGKKKTSKFPPLYLRLS